MGTLNYTTTVPANRTIGDMQALLAGHGAAAVAVRYIDGKPIGLTFTLSTPHGPRHFTLPVNVPAVHRLLIEQDRTGKLTAAAKRKKGSFSTPEHAERVAWRVAKDWLEAQLALIEAAMATLDQVMLPYLHVDGELTLYDAYRDSEQRALPSGAR
jgi:hypothetical protein